jgi:hypothetical protein
VVRYDDREALKRPSQLAAQKTSEAIWRRTVSGGRPQLVAPLDLDILEVVEALAVR